MTAGRCRLRAAIVSLSVSAVLLGAIFALVYLLWYPEPYFRIKGASGIVWLLAAVQLVLGPVLTGFLYRPGKESLLLDLVVIGVLQAGALAYGLTTLYLERPRYVVFAVDRFSVLAEREIDFGSVPPERFRPGPLEAPRLVVASLPQDGALAQRLLQETLFEGRPDIDRRPEFWSDYAQGWRGVVAYARSVTQLRSARPESAARIDAAVRAIGRPAGSLVFVPVIGRHEDFAIIVDPETGQPLDAVAVDPWLP